ncbi:hypothetical protein HY009_08455 [Candidatus Acetothermia bacterium]|nr:hypothetical protein [Candidatus Acetothermia bacterium]
MSLEHLGFIELPSHQRSGGFDHADVHTKMARLYVAHTANDALDVIDCVNDRYLHSITNLGGVAGALVSAERDLVFTSNRGEDTVGIFVPANEASLDKVKVGIRPNGLAYDRTRNLLLAANVGDPAVPNSYTVSMVDVRRKVMIADIPVPGRTRWAIFDGETDLFFVNIADPPQIVAIDPEKPKQIARTFEISVAGPHGLELDQERRRLFCACDGKKIVCVDVLSGRISEEADLSGVPDVIFFNHKLRHLYVAIGDPGVIDVFDTQTMKRLATVPTEKGAHTIAMDEARNKVYAFLPQMHRAAVYVDRD